jgi:hypothetical protein
LKKKGESNAQQAAMPMPTAGGIVTDSLSKDGQRSGAGWRGSAGGGEQENAQHSSNQRHSKSIDQINKSSHRTGKSERFKFGKTSSQIYMTSTENTC